MARDDADRQCVEFLQWALPRLGLRWAGFRKVRRQVCRRVRRRLDEVDLRDLGAYRMHLELHPDEWAVLDSLTHITISRFYRDVAVFEALEREVLPALAATADRDRLRAWSAGCASGEEAYTLALIGSIDVLATDVDPAMLRRARQATYMPTSLRELPANWRDQGFTRRGDRYVLRPEHRARVTVRRHDLRDPAPAGLFDLVLCRYTGFTYLAEPGQRTVLGRLTGALRPGGALVIGLHESLPAPAPDLEPWPGTRAIFRAQGTATTSRNKPRK